jgi:CubicO group peptidase (beta-lactamase class C family)
MVSATPGVVTGAVRTWLRLEGLAVMVAAALLFAGADYSWLLFALLFLAPDLSFLGYLAGPRAGAVAYNALHSYVGPLFLAVVLLLAGLPQAVPLVWAAHIGFDRVLGFGLKYPTAFSDTHLGSIRSAGRVLAIIIASGVFTLPLPVAAQQRSGDVPAAVHGGFSQQRLARIDSVFDGLVERAEMVGAVVLVLRDGEPVYERAFGWADREAGRRMTTDAIFRIASQTKALTSVAIMMLVEEGRLGLNDPVGRYLPAYGQTTVAVPADSGRMIVAARRAITIRDLLTHTAGISYGTDNLVAALYREQGLGPAAGFGWYTADRDEPICDTMGRLATLPFVAQPGERYVYGYATDVLGCVIERVSGEPLDDFIARRIVMPLGMRDTHFFLPPSESERLATVYMRSAEGTMVRAPEGARGQGDYVTGPRRSFAGGAGLVSTARDYARFLQMLLNGGILDNERLLAPATVRLMTTNQVDTLFSRHGEGFSLGFRTLDRAGARGRIESVGTYDWGGAYGSAYMVDPRERLVLVFLTQELPNVSRVSERLPMLVYQALVETRR